MVTLLRFSYVFLNDFRRGNPEKTLVVPVVGPYCVGFPAGCASGQDRDLTKKFVMMERVEWAVSSFTPL